MCDWMSDDMLKDMTPSLLGDHPNTYTFTKALAETLLVNECGSLPVAIVRPSIVTAAWNEPIQGWVEGLNGPTGIIAGTYKGILRSLYSKSEASTDIIPVDVVINLMVALVWFMAIKGKNAVQFYNCTPGALNPINCGQLNKAVNSSIEDNPSSQAFRYPHVTNRESRISNMFWRFFDHLLPGYLIDMVMIMLGRNPFMVELYGKIHRSIDFMEPFTTKEWLFRIDNMVELFNQLHVLDKKVKFIL